MMSVKIYFDLWLSKVKLIKKYDIWCGLHNEHLLEEYKVEF